jgi:glycine dehydrogenase subunit 2
MPDDPKKPLPLIFEQSRPGNSAVRLPDCDVPPCDIDAVIPADLRADGPPALPEVGELDLVRHYTRLNQRTFSVDTNFYPLGSCTMKYNPKINERAAAMPGFANLHPHQSVEDSQGVLELLYRTRLILQEVAGLHEVSLQPAAGAHGELASLFVINAYHRDHGGIRNKVLTPDTAHGTNPASCAMCGRQAIPVRSNPDGSVCLEHLRELIDEDTAALMLTHPNTVGKFDTHITEIAKMLHDVGAFLYVDGANMNAICGITRPGDLGADIMHYNTHKTFSTPHGGGGPGSGPIAAVDKLAPYLPTPQVVKREDGTFAWDDDRPRSIGKVRSFYGQVGVLVRAYAFLRTLGNSGLKEASETAVLAANYLASRLKDHYELPYEPPYGHEFILMPNIGSTEIRELDIAKRLIDFGYHPPTMSWPVAHCLMIEPTETESKATLDAFADAMIQIKHEAEESPEKLKQAPHNAAVRRLDEVAAARKPRVRWTPESVA